MKVSWGSVHTRFWATILGVPKKTRTIVFQSLLWETTIYFQRMKGFTPALTMLVSGRVVRLAIFPGEAECVLGFRHELT